jgi:hypothetical protein
MNTHDTKPMAQSLKDAVFTVIEGFNIPPDVRKILETAYYATPPAAQQWVGLTEKDYIEVTVQHFGKNGVRWFEDSLPNFVKSVESRLKEKNRINDV